MIEPARLGMHHREWETVRAILKAHVPEFEVWAFGSRAAGTARAYSDLDLAIAGEAPLDNARRAALHEAFVESDLPWKVDLVDWVSVGERFRRAVEGRGRVVVQPAGSVDPAPEGHVRTRPMLAHEARA
jgi:predicted nucleotidyltransferase